jgi:hypothetical protein
VAYLQDQRAELEAAWQERHEHHRQGKTIPEALERRYWSAVARVLYVGAHLEQQDGGGKHIPPGVAVEAAWAIWSALEGHPPPVFDRKGGRVPSPDAETDERIAAELVMLSGYGGRPRWLDVPSDFIDRVAQGFGVSRTAVTRWVQKYGPTISGAVRAAI